MPGGAGAMNPSRKHALSKAAKQCPHAGTAAMACGRSLRLPCPEHAEPGLLHAGKTRNAEAELFPLVVAGGRLRIPSPNGNVDV